MATLTAWKFDYGRRRASALTRLEHLQRESFLTLIDGAVVPGRLEPRSRRPGSSTVPRPRVPSAAPSGACCSV